MHTSISSLNITWYYTINIELGIYKYVFYKLQVVKLCLEKLNKIRRLLLLGTKNLSGNFFRCFEPLDYIYIIIVSCLGLQWWYKSSLYSFHQGPEAWGRWTSRYPQQSSTARLPPCCAAMTWRVTLSTPSSGTRVERSSSGTCPRNTLTLASSHCPASLSM